jgi:hypothetical protein
MAEKKQCEFFLLRYVPDAVKDEFVNIGVVLVEAGDSPAGFANLRFTQDWSRVRCLDPAADIEMLAALEADLRKGLAEVRERDGLLRKLNDSFSNTLQLSPVKACLAESPREELGRLAEMYLESRRGRQDKEEKTRAAAGRQAIFQRMRAAFEHAGVWRLPQMRKRIAVAQYTRPGDPLKLDCGYRPNGMVRLFHAVSLATEPDSAKVLAFSFPQIAAGIRKAERAKAELTAVVEDKLDRKDEVIAFALATLKQSRIEVATAADLPRIAEAARRELRA